MFEEGLIIHNNWISGRLKMPERRVLSGLWDYDPGTRMCLRPVSLRRTFFRYPASASKRHGETFGVRDYTEVQAMLKRVAHSFGLVEHKEKGSRRNSHQGHEAVPEFYPQSNNFVVRIIHAGGHQELYRHAVPASKLMTKYPGMCVARPEVFRVPHESVLWHGEVLVPGHKYILISFRDVEKLKRKLFGEGRSIESDGMGQDTKTRSPSGAGHKDKVKVPNGVAGHEALDSEIHCGHSHRENGKVKEPNGVVGQRVFETRKTMSPKGRRDKSVEDTVDSSIDSSPSEGGVENSFSIAKDFYVPKEKSTTTVTTTKPSRRKGIKGKKPFVPPLPKQRQYRSLGWQPSLLSVKELSP
ncbi:hypothetical protein Fmac_005679 [Flemingia macrophylla]|uniref:Uncharacterized protein n=1 Tax=Flemingia macrophylla TaxID=520843 RepID=A0ABD1N8F9_9FABA